jgi:hypothetical protein
MALGSNQPLREMSKMDISWDVKAAGAYGWQPYNFHVAILQKCESLSHLEPCQPVQASVGISLPLLLE